MAQTLGKFPQYQLAEKIYLKLGTKEFLAEELKKHGVTYIGSQLHGLVIIGVLERKRDGKERNRYHVCDERFQMLKRRWVNA
jgi:hypothetical protein